MGCAASGVHAAGASPVAGSFDWGYVTTRQSSLYLHIADHRRMQLALAGLLTEPAAVLDRADGAQLPFTAPSTLSTMVGRWHDEKPGRGRRATGVHAASRRRGALPYPVLHHWSVIRSETGRLRVPRAGEHDLSMENLVIVDSKWDSAGVNLIGIRLEPVA